MSRYDQLVDLINKFRPSIIVEVGVHRGTRAKLMCETALRHSRTVHYIGFDVFDTMSADFQKAAMNGKGMATEAQARKVLDTVRKSNPRFTYELRVGDTRLTLHQHPMKADFAFIDGDHRVEAIRGDYWALSETPVIVFDDFIIPGPRGEMVDTRTLGANVVIDEINESGVTTAVLPHRDLCNHGAFASLVLAHRTI